MACWQQLTESIDGDTRLAFCEAKNVFQPGEALWSRFPCSGRFVDKPEVMMRIGSAGITSRLPVYSGAVPRSTDDRLRTSSFQRVANYTSISLINGYAG